MTAVATTTDGQAVPQKTNQQMDEERVHELLAQLGGMRVSQDNLTFEGKKLVIPTAMSASDAVGFLNEWIEAQEEETAFVKVFNYRPWDGAFALQAGMKRVLGNAGIGMATWSFFTGKNPPEQRSIKTGPHKTEQVPWGAIRVPTFEGQMHLGAKNHPELGKLFHLTINAPKKYAAEIEGLFAVVEEELRHRSIYKGKAIDGQEDAEFIDLERVDPAKVIYSDQVMSDLEAHIWSLLRHTALMEEMGIPLKRANLLHGPYGTGKTLAAFLTAKVAVEHGWSFIYCRPGKDNIYDVMATARLYQPAVVFYEDIDVLAQSGEDDEVTKLLDVFDGIQAKGTRIMVVMTTNFPERIHKGMLRPGRLDSLIEIAELDQSGVQRLIESVVPDHMRGYLDYSAIHEAMEGFLPAFAKEAVDRTVRYAVARTGSRPTTLETEDFVHAAMGLRPQFDRMEQAKEGQKRPTLAGAMEDTIASVIHENTTIVDSDGDPVGDGWRFAPVEAS